VAHLFKLKQNRMRQEMRQEKKYLIAVATGLPYEYPNKHWLITIFRCNLSTGTNLKA
jgi:hypothetical protein